MGPQGYGAVHFNAYKIIDTVKKLIIDKITYVDTKIENIGKDLGQVYDIPNYDAFRRRGGFYHDPIQDVNLPYCRHIWIQELVKRK